MKRSELDVGTCFVYKENPDSESITVYPDGIDRFMGSEFYIASLNSEVIVLKQKKGGFEKIADAPEPCMHREHNPPTHIALAPGTYRYTCPGCGSEKIITIPKIY